MVREIELYGVFLPPFLLALVVAVPICYGLQAVLQRVGFYKWVWHRPLVDLSLLVIVDGAVTSVLLYGGFL